MVMARGSILFFSKKCHYALFSLQSRRGGRSVSYNPLCLMSEGDYKILGFSDEGYGI